MCPGKDFEEQQALFKAAGFSLESAQAIAAIDGAMGRLRRGMAKREFLQKILSRIDPNADMMHLDVMTAISGDPMEFTDGQDQEVTVGLIAERLAIDPSRASRLAAEVVDLGYARRFASQSDSRRICLELTEAGIAFRQKVRQEKWRMLTAGLSSWTEDELTTFARLLDRYSRWGKDGLKVLDEAAAKREAELVESK